jgi:hypothetical protein
LLTQLLDDEAGDIARRTGNEDQTLRHATLPGLASRPPICYELTNVV